jgi:hypothetical protein
MYLSMHNAGVCVTLPVTCNDHDVTLIWDEYREGRGYWLAGVYCPTCAGTYLPVQDEWHAPFFVAQNDARLLCDDLGGY